MHPPGIITPMHTRTEHYSRATELTEAIAYMEEHGWSVRTLVALPTGWENIMVVVYERPM